MTRTSEFIPKDAHGVEDGIIKSIMFFPGDVSYSVADWFFLQTKIGHYRHLKAIGEGYNWMEYTAKLIEKGGLWDESKTSFQEVLGRMNFKPACVSQGWKRLNSF